MAGKPVELRFITRKTVKAVEWPARPGAPPALAVSGREPEVWDSFAGDFAGAYRVVAASPESAYDLINMIWSLGEPAVVLAQGGKDCATAARAAISGIGAVRALVLIELAGTDSLEWLRDVKVPTLLFRGRQSTTQSHEDAVAAHQLLPNSRLIEPEDCGDNPVESSPAVLAQAVGWYLSSLDADHMDYPVNGDPIDPRQNRS